MLRQRLVRHARFAVGNDALADDLVQETLIAVVERLAQYRGDATLITWAVAILKHKVADWYRSPVRARTTQIDAEQDELAGRPTHDANGRLLGAAPASQEPANLLENREMMSALTLCVGAMPPQTAHVFLMHDWQGYTMAEICSELLVSAGAGRQMLCRARRVVRDCIVHGWVECKGRKRTLRDASTSSGPGAGIAAALDSVLQYGNRLPPST